MKHHRDITEFFAALLSAFLIRWGLHLAGLTTQLVSLGWFVEVIVDTGLWALSVGLIVGISVASYWRHYLRLYHALKRIDGPLKHSFLASTDAKIHDFVDKIWDPVQVSGKDCTLEEVDELATICFATKGHEYIGIESSVPGVYKVRYPHYLERSRPKTQGTSGSARVLVCLWSDLEADWEGNQEDFKAFHNWHIKNNIKLLHCNPADAENLRNQYNLVSRDLGLWKQDCALFFRPEQGGMTWLKFETDPTKPSFRLLEDYVVGVVSKSTVIKVVGDRLSWQDANSGELDPVLNGIKSKR